MVMKKSYAVCFAAVLLGLLCGCASDKLPSEDIEVLTKYDDIIRVLKSPTLPPNSQEKYEAAKALIEHVDLYYTRETGTVNKLFYYRDAMIDAPGSDNPVFTFIYEWKDRSLRIRFFTFRMFVTRVEIIEK